MKEVESIFGWHLFFLILVLIGTVLLWVYVYFIRPQPWFRDFQKQYDNVAAGFGTATPGTVAHLDENNLTGSLTLVPGEAVFFNEELALSFGGVFGSCSKLSVTNLRVIAQKTETIFFGTCSVSSPPDPLYAKRGLFSLALNCNARMMTEYALSPSFLSFSMCPL